MNRNYFLSLIFFIGVSGLNLNAQINSVSFDHSFDEIAKFRVTFESYYLTTGGSRVWFTMEDTLQYSFYWETGDGAAGSLPVLMHQYETPGTYLVNLAITDPEGMTYMADEYVTIEEIEELQVPNVFAPDGNTNTFIVRSDGITPLSITIMDRSGNVVYKHTAPVINWDGRTAGGTRVRPGVYYYVISSSEPGYNKNGFFHIFYNR